MVHDSVIDAVIAGLRDLGKERVWDTTKVAVFVDHAAPAPTPVVADSHRVLREWVRAQGIATFYDAGEGVCHQIMVEEGYCEPGTVIVGSDSHSNSYGAVGAFGAGMGASDVAVALALGRTWLRVPESIKVTFTGRPRKGVTMKDAIMRVVREIGTDGARYACVEFHGAGSLAQGDRITLAGMTTEMGAKAGIVADTPEAPGWLFPAGAVIGSSGCGPCLGRTGGVLAGSEICLSTANRNYRGRMGSPDAFIYIGSPYVAAVAALTGVIDDPRPYLEATEDELDALVARRRAERPGRGAASVRSGDRSRELMVAAARSGVAAEIDD